MTSGFDFHDPLGVLQHRAPYGDEVELAAVEARGDLVELADARTFAAKCADEFGAESNGADADRRQPRSVLSPACEVESVLPIGVWKFRLENAALRAMNGIDACSSEDVDPALEVVRSAPDFRCVVGGFPL